MQGFLKPYQVEQIKKKYPVGTRIELDHMEGEADMPDGLRGTVKHVDDRGSCICGGITAAPLRLCLTWISFISCGRRNRTMKERNRSRSHQNIPQMIMSR